MRWEDVAELFEWEGSWRDLYVLDAGVEGWRAFLAYLSGSNALYAYSYRGPAGSAPRADEIFGSSLEDRGLMEIRVGQIEMNCHFFEQNQIELDFDPRGVRGQKDLDQLVEFMTRVSRSVGLPVILSPKNVATKPLVTVDASSGTLTWLSSTKPSPRERIYVRLLDEGVDVWRPVDATRVGTNLFSVVAGQPYDREAERWEFEPGAIVRCFVRDLEGGAALVAREASPN